MKKILAILFLIPILAQAQTPVPNVQRGDTTYLLKGGTPRAPTGNNELVILNGSRNVLGFFRNTGKGRGAFSLLTFSDVPTDGSHRWTTDGEKTAWNAKEDATNKSTSTSLGTSNTLYPTQNAVKTYVDAGIHDSLTSYNIYFDSTYFSRDGLSPSTSLQLNSNFINSKPSLTTIAGLRAMSSPSTLTIYYTTDKPGNWYYDAADLTSADNTGTILVSGTKRFKRIVTDGRVSLSWFNVTPGATNNSTAGVQAAIDWPQTRILDFGSDSSIVYAVTTITPRSNQRWQGAAKIVPHSSFAGYEWITYNPANRYSSSTPVNVVAGTNRIVTSLASNFFAGDFIQLLGGVSFNVNGEVYNYGHYSKILKIIADTIYVADPALESFATTLVKDFVPISNFHTDGLILDATGYTNISVFNLHHADNCSVDKIKIRSVNGTVGLNIEGANVQINAPNIKGFTNVVFNGTGYGMAVAGHHIYTFNPDIDSCKHAYTSATRSYMSTALNILGGRLQSYDLSALDYHGNVMYSRAENTQIVSNAQYVVTIRSGTIDLINDDIYSDNTSNATQAVGIYAFSKFNGQSTWKNLHIYTTSGSLPWKVNSDVVVESFVVDGLYSNQGIGTFATDLGYSNSLNGLIMDAPAGGFGAITFNDTTKQVDVAHGKFIDRGSAFSYSVNIQDTSFQNVTVHDNDYFVTDATQTSTRVRVNNTGSRIYSNRLHSENSTITPWNDFSTSKRNFYADNKRVNSAGNYFNFGYGTLPTANAFFVGDIITLLSGNVTTFYRCVQTASGVYDWHLSPTMSSTGVFDLGATGDIRAGDIANKATLNNARFRLTNSGPDVGRNISDGGSGLTIVQAFNGAASFGWILDGQYDSVSKFHFDKDGNLSAPNVTQTLTLVQMRAITGTPSTTSTYKLIDAGKEGDFRWNPLSTVADDGGVTIKATAITTGRFERVYNGAINLKWYCTGDGVTDDAVGLKAAVAAGNEIYIPQGTFITSDSIPIHEGLHMYGAGKNLSVIKATHAGSMLYWYGAGGSTLGSGYARNVRINDLRLDGSTTATSGIRWAYAYNWDIENVQTDSCATGFKADVTGFFWRFNFRFVEAINGTNGYDFALNSTIESVPVSMYHVTARAMTGYGMVLRNNFVELNVYSGEFNHCLTGVGIYGSSTKAVSLLGVSFENNTTGLDLGNSTDAPQVALYSPRFLVDAPGTGKRAITATKGSFTITGAPSFTNYPDTAIYVTTNVTNSSLCPSRTFNIGSLIMHNSVSYTSNGTFYEISGSSISQRTASAYTVAAVTGNLTGNVSATTVDASTNVTAAKIGVGVAVGSNYPVNVSQTAVSSNAEEVARFTISDDNTSWINIKNNSSTDATFDPALVGRSSSNRAALTVIGEGTTDAGSTAVVNFQARTAAAAVVVTRPIFAWANFGTNVMTMLANGNLGLNTGSTVSAKFHVISTTEQVRAGYDASNYLSITTGSTGQAVYNVQGTGVSHLWQIGGSQRAFLNSSQFNHSVNLIPASNNTYTLGDATHAYASGWFGGKLTFDATNTAAGTTGAQTINKPTGKVNFAASTTSLVVTNSLVTTSSIVDCTPQTNDANKPVVYAVVPGSGSFTIYLTTGPAAELPVTFRVTN